MCRNSLTAEEKRGCYNLRSQVWWPSRCFQQKEIIFWPRYTEFELSCIWEISSMFLKHPRGLQIRMRCLKMARFRVDNTPALLRATSPCFVYLKNLVRLDLRPNNQSSGLWWHWCGEACDRKPHAKHIFAACLLGRWPWVWCLSRPQCDGGWLVC